MENFEKYIDENKDYIKRLSESLYNSVTYNSLVLYSFDNKEFIQEICFARLHSQMYGFKSNATYILKLPYRKEDKLENLDNIYINYTSIFEEMKDMVKSIFNVEVYKTGYKNIKLINFEKKGRQSFNIRYSLLLILFTILRSMDNEYASYWRKVENKEPIPKNLEELLYKYTVITDGTSGHDVNDNIANIYSNKNRKLDLTKILIRKYFNTLKIAFGEDGLVNTKEFRKLFKDNFINNSRYADYAMQTGCFSCIEKTVNTILLEENKK